MNNDSEMTVLDRLTQLNSTINNLEEALRTAERYKARGFNVSENDVEKAKQALAATKRELDWLEKAISRR